MQQNSVLLCLYFPPKIHQCPKVKHNLENREIKEKTVSDRQKTLSYSVPPLYLHSMIEKGYYVLQNWRSKTIPEYQIEVWLSSPECATKCHFQTQAAVPRNGKCSSDACRSTWSPRGHNAATGPIFNRDRRRQQRMSTRQLPFELADASGIRVSKQTVYRRLRAVGLSASHPTVCVPLTRVLIWSMGGSPGDVSENPVTQVKQRHSSFSNASLALPTSQLILQPFRCFTYVTFHSPNPSFPSPASQALHLIHLILQHFRHFTYVTAHSPTLPSLYLRHSSFSNPSVASQTSQFILQPFFRFT